MALTPGTLTYCHICLGEMLEPDENPYPCPHCGAIAIVVGSSDHDPYRDMTFAERGCDHCGQKYQGPAVYCSLECALEDA